MCINTNLNITLYRDFLHFIRSQRDIWLVSILFVDIECIGKQHNISVYV